MGLSARARAHARARHLDSLSYSPEKTEGNFEVSHVGSGHVKAAKNVATCFKSLSLMVLELLRVIDQLVI